MRVPVALRILPLVGGLAGAVADEDVRARLQGRVEGARARSFLELRVDDEPAPRLVALASDGTFACEALPAGRAFEVVLRWEGFQAIEEELGLNRDQRRRFPLAQELVLVPGETRTVHWRVPPPTRVRGRALLLPERTPFVGPLQLLRAPSGSPAGEVKVLDFERYPDRIEPAPDGTFDLGMLMPGRWWIGAEFSPELTFRPLARAFEVGAGQQELELRVEVERTPFVTGRVLSASGRSAQRARVDAPGGLDLVFSDLDGNFRFPLVDPASERLQARLRGHADSEWVEVLPGQTDVVLRLRRASRLLVRAFDRSGTGLEPELRVLDEESGESLGSGEPLAGELRVEPLPAGRYTLLATHPVGVACLHGVELAEGETRSLALVLEPPEAELEVLPIEGERRLFELRVFRDGLPVARGGVGTKPLRVPVPAGVCELRVLEPAGSERRVLVEAKRGEVRRVELGRAHPPPGERASDAGGAPIRR